MKKRKPKVGDRVCDMHGSQWGTVHEILGEIFCTVVWDSDIKKKPKRDRIGSLWLEGEKHPFNKRPFSDPKKETPVAKFKDSVDKAKRDRQITTLHYHEGVFREFFTTPYSDQSKHVGKKFDVIIQTRKSGMEDGEHVDDMYLIRFEDGTEIQAYGHEVCVLDYERCHPVFPA